MQIRKIYVRRGHLPPTLAIANHQKQNLETLGLATATFQRPITRFMNIEG